CLRIDLAVERGAWKIPIGKLLEDGLADRTGRTVLARAVHRNEQANAVVDEQIQIGVKPRRVAGMRNDAMAVAVLLVEAEDHAMDARQHGERRGVHLLGNLRLQNASFAESSILQMRDH